MKAIEYTPKILTLIRAGKKLEAIKEAKDFYGISLVEAKNMINSYQPGGNNYYTTMELNDTPEYTPDIDEPIFKRTMKKKFICAVCGYIYKGDAAPEKCPICKAPASKLSELQDAGDVTYATVHTKPVESTTSVIQESQQLANTNEDILPYCCPNCGSNQVEKSIGGKLEHAAAWAATKGAKAYIMGDYGSFTAGVENDIIKEELPLQQVCNYCHYTFHARKSQIEAGKYSMSRKESARLTEAYNRKLKAVKDGEVKKIKEEASKKLPRLGFAGAALLIGFLITATCEHQTTGAFGLPSYTWSFMFSCVLIFFGILGVVVEGIGYSGKLSEANEIDRMPLHRYAKDHKA